MKIILTLFVFCKLAIAFEITNNTFHGTTSLIDEVKDDIRISFQRFVEKYDKRYESEDEYEKKFSIYYQNFIEVEKHNKHNPKWKKTMNNFKLEVFKSGRRAKIAIDPNIAKTPPNLSGIDRKIA